MITMITPSEPTGQLLIDRAAFRKYNVEMYRVLFEDGTISDLVNKSRAKDLMRDDTQTTAEMPMTLLKKRKKRNVRN